MTDEWTSVDNFRRGSSKEIGQASTSVDELKESSSSPDGSPDDNESEGIDFQWKQEVVYIDEAERDTFKFRNCPKNIQESGKQQ